jgi:hypothetical protein
MVILKAGAVVEFRPGNKDGLCSGKEDQRLAAIVCFVAEDNKKVWVNLRVFDENGNGYARTEVAVVQPKEEVASGDVLAEAGYCRPVSRLAVEGNAVDAARLRSAEDKSIVRVEEAKVVGPKKPKSARAAEKEEASK